MARRGIELCEMVPSAVASAMENAVIDAGPVPLVECFRLGGRVDPVAGFCVASRKQAGSIFLFSTKPIQELQGASIGIIGAASTAQRLLHVLLRLKYRVQPAAYVPLDLPHDAFLLVGNQGLRQRMGAPGFPHTYDLGAEWYAWTGLPFVFSRWMVRHDVDPGDKALLQDTLYVGLEEGVNALYGIAKPRVDLLMLPRDIITYIQGLHYYVGLEEEKAIERFHQYLQQVAQ
jgi:chorismate dehydratase